MSSVSAVVAAGAAGAAVYTRPGVYRFSCENEAMATLQQVFQELHETKNPVEIS